MTLRPVHRIEDFFGGYAFAAYLLGVLGFITLLLAFMLFVPVGDGALGAFAADFKTWCFNYDPATGRIDVVYAAVMLLNPLMLMAIVSGIWWKPLRTAATEKPRGLYLTLSAAALSVAVLAAGIAVLGPTESPTTALPFPAERLRTEMSATDFSLQNQDGDTVTLSDLRGRVVMITAVYANCHTACPTIIVQAKRAASQLPPELREHLTIVAITLDPENDTRERLAATANTHDLEAPFFNFVNGSDPQVVEDLLDAYSFSRVKNPETGVIDHANMFVLVDTRGKIAYRLTLGDRHQTWLSTALTVLLREADTDN